MIGIANTLVATMAAPDLANIAGQLMKLADAVEASNKALPERLSGETEIDLNTGHAIGRDYGIVGLVEKVRERDADMRHKAVIEFERQQDVFYKRAAAGGRAWAPLSPMLPFDAVGDRYVRPSAEPKPTSPFKPGHVYECVEGDDRNGMGLTLNVCKGSLFDAMKGKLQADESYAWSWHCNLACPIIDGIALDDEDAHEHGNRIAATQMRNVFDIDVTTFDVWKEMERQWAEARAALHAKRVADVRKPGVKPAITGLTTDAAFTRESMNIGGNT